MQAVSKLAIVLVTSMNLAGVHAVGKVEAWVSLLVLLVVGLAVRLGYSPLADPRLSWGHHLASHRDALTRRFRQLVRINAYGFEEQEKWLDELERFRRSVGLRLEKRQVAAFQRFATRRVRRWSDRDAEAALDTSEGAMSPEDYEHHCAEMLRREGWTAEVTGMSGDQGIDVLAERDGVSVAIQCKLHFSRPIGNKAVQEAHAAAGFAETSHAAVVSNAAFTRSAETLAQRLGVFLLHHSDLPRLEMVLRGG
jgi:restriction system protein